jgi:hypothetical protein
VPVVLLRFGGGFSALIAECLSLLVADFDRRAGGGSRIINGVSRDEPGVGVKRGGTELTGVDEWITGLTWGGGWGLFDVADPATLSTSNVKDISCFELEGFDDGVRGVIPGAGEGLSVLAWRGWGLCDVGASMAASVLDTEHISCVEIGVFRDVVQDIKPGAGEGLTALMWGGGWGITDVRASMAPSVFEAEGISCLEVGVFGCGAFAGVGREVGSLATGLGSGRLHVVGYCVRGYTVRTNP